MPTDEDPEGSDVVGTVASTLPRMTCSCEGADADATVEGLVAAVRDGRLVPRPRGQVQFHTPMQATATEPMDAPFPVPSYPPREWFTDKPDWLTPGMKVTVDDEGRVAGYFYEAGQCLVHDHSACVQASPTLYGAFHQNDVALADGSILRVGVIGNTHGHADPFSSINAAVAHYADPSRQLIECLAYDDEHGGYILGSMVPETGAERRPLNYGDVALIRRSALSGDWRPFPQSWFQAHGHHAVRAGAAGEWYDCIGPTLVTRPGLPLIKRFGQRAAALGGSGGVQLDEQEQHMDPNSTVIDLPGGGKVTIPGANGAAAMPPGPQPVQAAADPRLAAPPATPPASSGPAANDPNSTPAEEAAESPDVEQLEARVTTLEQQVTELQGVVGQLIDAVSAPMAASVALPPPE